MLEKSVEDLFCSLRKVDSKLNKAKETPPPRIKTPLITIDPKEIEQKQFDNNFQIDKLQNELERMAESN